MTEPRPPATDPGSESPASRRRALLGRRGFVATLLAGTAMGAAAGQVLPRWDAEAGASVLPEGATVLAGTGIDPSGAEDSTSALQSLIDAAPEGAPLWLPAGLYRVDGLVLR